MQEQAFKPMPPKPRNIACAELRVDQGNIKRANKSAIC